MTPPGLLLLLGSVLVASAPPAPAGRLYVVDAHAGRGATGSGLWRPTIAQAAAAREALRRYVLSSAPARIAGQEKAARAVATGFDGYVIQAEGVRAPGGNGMFGTEGAGPKQIHLDGFCPWIADRNRDRIDREMLVILDGGACIFQAMYDVRSRTITRFAANGVA